MNTARYRAIDHVMVRLSEIDRLLSIFGTVLDLPVSWKKQTSNFATFAWVHVGNTDLEFWAATNNADLPSDSQPPLIHGVAFDPVDLAASIADLANVGIQCKSPRPYQTLNASGTSVTNFTNSVVLDLSSESCCAFFCAWDPQGTIFPWAERITSAERQSRDQKELIRRKGGALGLVGLAEIEVSTPTLSETVEKWRTFSGSKCDPISLTSDINLRLVSGTRHAIQSLTFNVRSLVSAQAFLGSKGLLGATSTDELMLAPHAVDGLIFKFRETKADWDGEC